MKGHTTRSARSRREFWKRFGIWVFIFVFAFSVVGGAIAIVAQLFAGGH